MQTFEETRETISLHGLGFVQVKLQGGQRLHVWHPDLPRRRCFEHSSIHNHRFGFVSTVLVGTQINVDYEVEPSRPYDKNTHVRYLHEGKRAAHGGRPWIPDGEVHVREQARRVITAGLSYTMKPFEFHATVPGGDGKVATVMRKVVEFERGAHSLCAIGIEPDAAFDRKQCYDGELWDIVTEVLGRRIGDL